MVAERGLYYFDYHLGLQAGRLVGQSNYGEGLNHGENSCK